MSEVARLAFVGYIKQPPWLLDEWWYFVPYPSSCSIRRAASQPPRPAHLQVEHEHTFTHTSNILLPPKPTLRGAALGEKRSYLRTQYPYSLQFCKLLLGGLPTDYPPGCSAGLAAVRTQIPLAVWRAGTRRAIPQGSAPVPVHSSSHDFPLPSRRFPPCAWLAAVSSLARRTWQCRWLCVRAEARIGKIAEGVLDGT